MKWQEKIRGEIGREIESERERDRENMKWVQTCIGRKSYHEIDTVELRETREDEFCGGGGGGRTVDIERGNEIDRKKGMETAKVGQSS